MNAPDKIYFQINEDWTPESGYPQFEGVTWSTERVNDSDVLYVRVSDRATRNHDDCICSSPPPKWLRAGWHCPKHGAKVHP